MFQGHTAVTVVRTTRAQFFLHIRQLLVLSFIYLLCRSRHTQVAPHTSAMKSRGEPIKDKEFERKDDDEVIFFRKGENNSGRVPDHLFVPMRSYANIFGFIFSGIVSRDLHIPLTVSVCSWRINRVFRAYLFYYYS